MTDYMKLWNLVKGIDQKRSELEDLDDRLDSQKLKLLERAREAKRWDLVDRIHKAAALTKEHSKLMDKIYGKRKQT